MKRETVQHLKRQHRAGMWAQLSPTDIESILATDAENRALRAENERFRETILWADGLGDGTFRPRRDGEGLYWWRTELMERAAPVLRAPRPKARKR